MPLACEKFTRELLGDVRSNHASMKAKVKAAVESALKNKDPEVREKALKFCDAKFDELQKRTADEAEAAILFDEDLEQAPPSVKEAYESAQKRASDLQAENTSLEQELAALRSKLQTAMEAPKSAACVIL